MVPQLIRAHKSPSTAFCLLLRLFTIRCTKKQMALMLDHVDSPYIRCIGLLYLRYAADPANLWYWFEPYLYDEESAQVRQGQADTTVGKYAQMLLNDLDYYGTRLPRLPLTIERQCKVKLLQAERVEERAKKHSENKAAMEYFQKAGARVQALYGDEENPVTWYDAVVDRVILRDQESAEILARPKFQVSFPQYGNSEIIQLGEIDLPGSNDSKPRSIERGEMREGSDKKSGGRDYPTDDRDRGRGYDRGDDRGKQGYDNYRGNHGEREASSRGFHDSRDRGYGSGRHDNRHDSTDRDNRRERSRSRDRGDNLNDARREEQELMKEVLRRERDKTAAKGKAHAARPATFKDSMGSSEMRSRHMTMDRGSNSQPKPGRDYAKEDINKPTPAPVVKKTAAELAAIEEKKRKLRAKYG